MKAKAGRLFEAALMEAEIDLKPGTEIKVIVKGKGDHLQLVVGPPHLNEFETSILERAKRANKNLPSYQPKLPLGERIRTLRKTAGLTLAALASKAEMSQGSLCSIEKGNRPAALAVLRKIARAMEIPVTVLVDGH